jgi:hypothetical protein
MSGFLGVEVVEELDLATILANRRIINLPGLGVKHFCGVA